MYALYKTEYLDSKIVRTLYAMHRSVSLLKKAKESNLKWDNMSSNKGTYIDRKGEKITFKIYSIEKCTSLF